MKTNYTRLLINSALVLVSVSAVLVSCTKEPDYPGRQDDDFIEMTITVGQDTKTINDGNSTLWTEGDALSVIHSAASGNVFWPSYFYWFGNYSFTGKVNKLSASNDWYAVYPYDEEHVSADDIGLTFPSAQVQTGNSNKKHFAGETFPLFGKTEDVSRSTELSIRMRNILSAAEFSLTNTTSSPIVVKEIEFTAPSAISGTFKVDLTGDDPVITPAERTLKSVKLLVSEGEEIAPGESAAFYMAVVPFEAPAGSELQIKATAVHPDDPETLIRYYHTISLENPTTFTQGLIKTVNVRFDEDHQTNPDPDAGSAGEVDLPEGGEPEDGVYLLVYDGESESYAFAAFSDYKSQKYAIPVTVVDGKVIPQDGQDLSVFAMEIEYAGMEHPNDAGHKAYNVRNSQGQYVFYSTGGGTLEAADALQIKDINEMDIDGTTYQYYHTFVQEADGVQILSSISGASGGNKYLLAYSSANGFYYEENNSGQKLHLYLLGGSAKEKQTPTFSTTSITYDFDALGEGILTNRPVLTGAYTTVTWSSNNLSVATVDPASGEVTIHGAGTAVITATAAADNSFYGASAQYTITVMSSNVQTWYKADDFVPGTQYLVVSNGYALQNNGGSIAATAVSVSDEVIMMNAPSAILWTANSSSQLTNGDQYLGSSSSGSGGGGYYPGYGSASLAIGSKSNAAAWTYNADNNTLTFSSSSGYTGSTTYYLYYSTSSNAFTVSSSSGSSHLASLYSTQKPLGKQFLSFAKSSVSWVIGEDCQVGESYSLPQTVTGNATPVTYTSSNTSVATISGDLITIVGKGSTTITATAQADDQYKEATAKYTFRVTDPAPPGFTALGTFNLENSTVSNYLDQAISEYTDDNYTSVSVVATYTNNGRPSKRLDVPEPVRIEWDSASSGTATITVFNDSDLSDEVWTWTASSGSKSFDIYNLIPGRTDSCTVIDSGGEYLLKGTFDTEGRRRMLKVSDTESANNANNCRDLGGLETIDGKRIKYGMIYRGTNLTSTTADEKKYLVEFMNIGLDNDLRDGSGGSSNRDNPFQNTSYDVAYCGPGYGTSIGSESTTNNTALTNPASVKQTMQAFIDCAKKGKASYFHCYIGSDRTGYWGFLVEALLGVSPKDCSIDFELTGFAGRITSGDRPRNSTGYTYYQGMNFFKQKSYYSTYEAQDKASAIQKTIEHYLINDVGISAEDIATFKNLVLE
ncbi:MAG: tyrosine-protein phosphatase [Bacteroidales bacterium]|nr:tyrosine-protein phosphatase [Bacteroidales bacterium]